MDDFRQALLSRTLAEVRRRRTQRHRRLLSLSLLIAVGLAAWWKGAVQTPVPPAPSLVKIAPAQAEAPPEAALPRIATVPPGQPLQFIKIVRGKTAPSIPRIGSRLSIPVATLSDEALLDRLALHAPSALVQDAHGAYQLMRLPHP